MKSIAITLLALAFFLSQPAHGEQVEREQTVGNFHVVELHGSETVAPIFTVTGIEVTDDAFLITVISLDPAQVATLIGTGRLEAESSDETGATTPVSLQLWRKCLCNGQWISSGFDVLRTCTDVCGASPEDEQFFFVVASTLPRGTDLAIGYEPASLWLFERQ